MSNPLYNLTNQGFIHCSRYNSYSNGKSRWHSSYILVYKYPLLTYLLVSVPSILTLRYMNKLIANAVIIANQNKANTLR